MRECPLCPKGPVESASLSIPPTSPMKKPWVNAVSRYVLIYSGCAFLFFWMLGLYCAVMVGAATMAFVGLLVYLFTLPLPKDKQ